MGQSNVDYEFVFLLFIMLHLTKDFNIETSTKTYTDAAYANGKLLHYSYITFN